MKDITYSATIQSEAIKSECGKFRYILKRVWNCDLEVNAFLCANPSKADHLLFDDTVYKCMNLAVRWGWGGYFLLNLYPNYSTDPRGMTFDPATDERNAHHVRAVLAVVDKLVIACGNGHDARLATMIKDFPRERLYCLRKNAGGGYQHPARINPESFPTPVRVHA